MKGNFWFGALGSIFLRQSSSRTQIWRPFQRFYTDIPPPNPKRLDGKMALITGAASGIGEATARLFAAHGARVLVADVQADAGSKLAAELGNGAGFIRCDVRHESDVAAAVVKAVAMSDASALDIFHYNVGVLGATGAIDSLPIEEFDQTLTVNLRGAVLGIKHAARVMKAARKGSIVVTGSVASVVGGMGPHAYVVSKTGLHGLVRSVAVELRRFGIRVNMVSPDSVPTPILARALQMLELVPEYSMKEAERFVDETTLMGGHALTVLDVANAVLYFASDESAYVSAQNLVVDAGNTVTKPHDNSRWFAEHMSYFPPGDE